MEIDSSFFMRLALNEAWRYQFLTYPNPAVGACLVDKHGSILAIEAHKEAGAPHAELLALKSAYLRVSKDERIESITDAFELHTFLRANHRNLFSECTLFVTLEPCSHFGKTPPCSLLLAELKLKRVVIGVLDEHSKGGVEFLRSKGIEVITGVLQKECNELIEPFLAWKKDGFLLYKWAQRLDGSLDGGYISSDESLRYVHAIRAKLDLLIIGGNSVRIDKPRLDARLFSQKAPNVAIVSNKNGFEKSIPLFLVPDRKVEIVNNVETIQKSGFMMIESGGGLLKPFLNKIDWFMCFVSLSNSEVGTKRVNGLSFELLHAREIGSDLLLFLKKQK